MFENVGIRVAFKTNPIRILLDNSKENNEEFRNI